VYDPKSEASEFIGATREEAVAKARQFFGREASELVIAELPGAVHGAGGRVVVVALPEGARIPRAGGGGGGGGGGDRGGRREGRSDRGDRGDRGGRFERGGRGGGRDRGDRGDRGERGGRGDRGDRGDRGERAPREERSERFAEAEPAAEPTELGAPEESVGTAVGGIQAIGQYILGVVERMALGPFEIRESDEADFIVFQLRGPAADRLAAGDGRTVDALQLVVNQAALRISEEHKRVVIDVEGNAAERDDLLARAAQRAAKRAQETGRAVALDPMSPKDRRGIHVALRDMRGIATMSIGSGRYRQVLVVPEGAPEFDEARRAAEQAAQQES
jgi:predicted RNA-binding protein Jag